MPIFLIFYAETKVAWGAAFHLETLQRGGRKCMRGALLTFASPVVRNAYNCVTANPMQMKSSRIRHKNAARTWRKCPVQFLIVKDDLYISLTSGELEEDGEQEDIVSSANKTIPQSSRTLIWRKTSCSPPTCSMDRGSFSSVFQIWPVIPSQPSPSTIHESKTLAGGGRGVRGSSRSSPSFFAVTSKNAAAE